MLSIAGHFLFSFAGWGKLNLSPIPPYFSKYSADMIRHFSPIWGIKEGSFHLRSALFIFSYPHIYPISHTSDDANPGSE